MRKKWSALCGTSKRLSTRWRWTRRSWKCFLVLLAKFWRPLWAWYNLMSRYWAGKMFLSFLRELVYCSAFKQHVFFLNYINILFPRPSVTSSKVSSCLSRLYQSLANLIRWSDQVMLEGVNLEDKETVTTVTTVIKAVLDGVKVLIVYRTLSWLVFCLTAIFCPYSSCI